MRTGVVGQTLGPKSGGGRPHQGHVCPPPYPGSGSRGLSGKLVSPLSRWARRGAGCCLHGPDAQLGFESSGNALRPAFPAWAPEALVRLPACRSWGGSWGQWLAEVSGPVGWSSEDRPPPPARWRLGTGPNGKGGPPLQLAPAEGAGWQCGRFRWHRANPEALPSSCVSWCLTVAAQAVPGPRVQAASEEAGFAAAVPLHRSRGAGQHHEDLLRQLHVFCVVPGARPLVQLGATPCSRVGSAAGCRARVAARGAPGSWCSGLSWTHSALPRPAGAIVSPNDPEPGGTPWSSAGHSAPRHGPLAEPSAEGVL